MFLRLSRHIKHSNYVGIRLLCMQRWQILNLFIWWRVFHGLDDMYLVKVEPSLFFQPLFGFPRRWILTSHVRLPWPPHTYNHACMHTYTHNDTYTHTHIRTNNHTRTHAHTHAPTHARTHARTNARTHARTHASRHGSRWVFFSLAAKLVGKERNSMCQFGFPPEKKFIRKFCLNDARNALSKIRWFM